MIKELIVDLCAPTLAGLKTGNLFSVKETEEKLRDEMRELNGVFSQKGLRLIPLAKADGSTLIYLYRPEMLEEDLTDPDARKILCSMGYPCESQNCCLGKLVRRVKSEKGFPHEIGLFLGYPPCDVKGFMHSSSEGVKCVGCWKVYGNEEEAQKTFQRYEKCTAAYRRLAKKGIPLESLIVPGGGMARNRVAIS